MPGEFDLPERGSARNEEIALPLLEAGTDLSRMDDGGYRSCNTRKKIIGDASWPGSRNTSKADAMR
jgi:hypothetical protein